MDESILVGTFLSYLVSLAASLRHDAIIESRQKKESEELARDTVRLQAIQDRRSLREQLRLVGTNVARTLGRLGEGKRERRLFHLLTDEVFQNELADWLVAWDPAHKKEAETTLVESLSRALGQSGEASEQVRRFKAEYMPLVEKALFKDPVLARWRLTLGMSAAIERIEELGLLMVRQKDEVKETVTAEIAAVSQRLAQISKQVRELDHAIARRFTEQERRAAVDRYRELALEACDIVDLANLPESDRHVATRALTLRRLYVPLRVSVELTAKSRLTDEALGEIEARRNARRSVSRGDSDKKVPERAPVGERLAAARRLVVLGDPGAGKTTLLRWIATAYLLRLKEDENLHDIPDVATLPDKDWLPILVRCRDLDPSSLAGSFDDVFRQTFRKSEMSDSETAALQAVLRQMLAEGDALLLVDGLDEITTPAERTHFCRQIERLHIAYPEAPIVVTSRIVGYREMGYHIGRSRGTFEHLPVADLSKDDKDDFARRWCEVVEPPERRETTIAELIHDVHSIDRIERLTGNPMLLTTLALVKRRVGKLPSRRADLYSEAVQVLLNWRSEVDDPINPHEAIPQLEYLAYEMCRRGEQRLREDEVLDL
ncbi:MAG: NACHT domain-containing protein, partial [bacterium]|nr:NACHT domain-containing protein [bacterium]